MSWCRLYFPSLGKWENRYPRYLGSSLEKWTDTTLVYSLFPSTRRWRDINMASLNWGRQAHAIWDKIRKKITGPWNERRAGVDIPTTLPLSFFGVGDGIFGIPGSRHLLCICCDLSEDYKNNWEIKCSVSAREQIVHFSPSTDTWL